MAAATSDARTADVAVLTRAGRRAVWAVLVPALVCTVWLTALVWHARIGMRTDYRTARWLLRHVPNSGARLLLDLSEPALTTSLCVAVAAAAAVLRRWRLVVWAAVSPVLAIVMTEFVLKPLVDRTIGYLFHGQVITVAQGHAFPSGHTTGLTSLTAELAVLALRAGWRPAARAGAVVVLGGWTLLGAAGLVRNYYHFATDTLGGIGVSVVCVLTVALAVDAVGDARARRRAAQFT